MADFSGERPNALMLERHGFECRTAQRAARQGIELLRVQSGTSERIGHVPMEIARPLRRETPIGYLS